MDAAWIMLGVLTLGGAVCAMSLRNLVHALLCLVVSFLGLAGIYLVLSAAFVALAQVLVYLGGVSILIVFAILLTRGGATLDAGLLGTRGWIAGLGVALLVLGGLAGAVLWGTGEAEETAVEASVAAIGERLMTAYVLPLEAMALLLTGALIGAVILAMPDRGSAGERAGGAGCEVREVGDRGGEG